MQCLIQIHMKSPCERFTCKIPLTVMGISSMNSAHTYGNRIGPCDSIATKALEICYWKSIENLLVGRLVVFHWLFEWNRKLFLILLYSNTPKALVFILQNFNWVIPPPPPQDLLWKASILLNISCPLLLSIKGTFVNRYIQTYLYHVNSQGFQQWQREDFLTLNRKQGWWSYPSPAKHTCDTSASSSASNRFTESPRWLRSWQVVTSL